jgi:5-methylcytosine-specific restriction endonuclease McrA
MKAKKLHKMNLDLFYRNIRVWPNLSFGLLNREDQSIYLEQDVMSARKFYKTLKLSMNIELKSELFQELKNLEDYKKAVRERDPSLDTPRIFTDLEGNKKTVTGRKEFEGRKEEELLEDVTAHIVECQQNSPVRLSDMNWLYADWYFQLDMEFDSEEAKLLIYECIDKERQKFEKLKRKYSEGEEFLSYNRVRIPEKVRIAVWRRDGGQCAKCNSKLNLEYDHIVPVSKGGSNSVQNVELLCRKCNRSKGDLIE